MKWSAKLGEFFGIGVYVHATFLILLGWVGFVHWQEQQSLAAALDGMLFITALFACVVMHEYGHALTARRYGIPTKDITLLPIGGVARLERMPEEPWEEFWVAVAGPAVNVVIAVGLYAALLATGSYVPLAELSIAGGSFWERLMVVNVFLVIFNMIPAFPMDGGRVLRALLAMRMPYPRATRAAASLGQGIALLFGLLGLFGNPILIFIALFVWIGAEQEAQATEMKSVLSGIPVEAAMMTEFRVLGRGDTLGQAVELLLSGSQQDYPVMAGEEVAGILTRADLLAGLAAHGQNWPVAAVMQKEFLTAEMGEGLEQLVQRLQGQAARTVPVMQNGRMVGLITMENIGEFISVRGALQAATPGY
jgi:Zn-dependent protease/CBS domain-containing protein